MATIFALVLVLALADNLRLRRRAQRIARELHDLHKAAAGLSRAQSAQSKE